MDRDGRLTGRARQMGRETERRAEKDRQMDRDGRLTGRERQTDGQRWQIDR